MITSKKCSKSDIIRIRNFLSSSYDSFPEKGNWLIDRLNFTFTVSRIINGVSEEEYCNRIRLFMEDDKIISIVNTEGENRGEAFFQISDFNVEDELLSEMFNFVDSDLMITQNGKKVVYLAINSNAEKIKKYAEKRGYTKENWSEITSKKNVQFKNKIKLPKGYRLSSALQTTAEQRAICHSFAFGYHDKPEIIKRSIKGQEQLKQMPDYNPKYDIQVVERSGNVVAFANMWWDAHNKFGILEPVGTHPDHRKLGLAKAAIYHAENLIAEEGAKFVYVGSNQPFYKRIGFYEVSEDLIYKFEKNILNY